MNFLAIPIILLLTLGASQARGSPVTDVNPWLGRDLSRAELMPPLRRAADYLLRNEQEDGQFLYIKDPLGRCCRKKGDRYSLIRHLGAVYALLRAHQLTGDPRYLDGASRGLEFTERFRDEQGLVRGLDGRHNLGENGFLLVDTVLLSQLNGDGGGSDAADAVAHFLTGALVFDGPYATKEHWAESQALIGLMFYHLHRRPSPSAVAAARAWLTAAADAPPSHWTVQAAYWFHRAAPRTSTAIAERALDGARELLAEVEDDRGGSASRLVGARAGRLYSCNATARAEGLVAAHLLARDLGRRSDEGFFFTRTREHLAYALQFQYGTPGSLTDASPLLKRIGDLFAMDGGLTDDWRKGFVRIDYTAHFVRAAATYLESGMVPENLGVTMDDLL